MTTKYFHNIQTVYPIGHGIYNLLTDVNVGNSITWTDLSCPMCQGSRVLPVDYIYAGRSMLIRASGVLKTNSTNQQLHMEFRANNTILSKSSPLIGNTKNEYRFFEIEIDLSIRPFVGSNAPVVSNGQWVYSWYDDTSLKNTYEGCGFLSTTARTGQSPAVSIDPTIEQDLSIFAKWNDIHNDNDIKVHSFTIYVC